MIKHTSKEYTTAINLREKGLGSLRISKKIGVPRSTVENWINKGAKPYYFSDKRIAALHSEENIKRLRRISKSSQPIASREAAKKNTKVLKSKKLSSNLAYILGVLYGDGCVSVKQRRVILSAIDKDFVEEFKKNLENWSKLKCRIYSRNIKTDNKIIRRKLQWVCYLDSVKASTFLANFDLDKLKNSSMKIKKAFIRGFIDSEGSVSKDSVIIYNTDKELLLFVKSLISSLNIDSKINTYNLKNNLTYKKINYSRLCLYGENLIKFYKCLNFSIDRKQRKLHSLIKLRQR